MKRERFAFVIPREGAVVPMPECRYAPMPAAGARVRLTPYYDQLIAESVIAPGEKPAHSDAPASSVEPEPAAKASKARS